MEFCLSFVTLNAPNGKVGSFRVTSKVEGDMDFLCDGSILICRAIYVAHEDGLGKWGGLESVFLHETPVYEHSSCSGVQEHGGGDRHEGSEGGELNLDVEGMGGVC